MGQVIPVQKNLPRVRQGQTLDGVDYFVVLEWNMRNGWFIGLNDANDTPIWQPARLVVDVDFCARARHDARCPPGVLTAFDVTGNSGDPGYLDLVSGSSENDLQGRVAITYWTLAEMTELFGG
jgi:hypothetical protein